MVTRHQYFAALIRTRAERLKAAGLGGPEKLPVVAQVASDWDVIRDPSYCSNLAFPKGAPISRTHMTSIPKEKKSA